jgi:hypothetical protein
MVAIQQTPRPVATNVSRGIRYRAYTMILVGFVIALWAYIRLIGQSDEASVAAPVCVAFLGLVVATLGFWSYSASRPRSSASCGGWSDTTVPSSFTPHVARYAGHRN